MNTNSLKIWTRNIKEEKITFDDSVLVDVHARFQIPLHYYGGVTCCNKLYSVTPFPIGAERNGSELWHRAASEGIAFALADIKKN